MNKQIFLIAGTIAAICALTSITAACLLEQQMAEYFLGGFFAVMYFIAIHAIQVDKVRIEGGK
jgi:hypothetical protein